MKTHTVKAGDIETTWFVVDAADKPLGRVATQVARVLRGKHRPEFTPHMTLGDHVIVINAEKIYLSGAKRTQKTYQRYSGYQGGLKTLSLEQVMAKDPTRVVRLAIKGMLPHTRLGRQMLKNLRVYAGSSHPHTAQTPADLPAF